MIALCGSRGGYLVFMDLYGLQQPVLCAIEWAIKKIGKQDYKGNDSESFSCCILIDIDFFNGQLNLDSIKCFVISAALIA